MASSKQRNPETKRHNLTLGERADIVTDPKIISELAEFCAPLREIFGIGFAIIVRKVNENRESFKELYVSLDKLITEVHILLLLTLPK